MEPLDEIEFIEQEKRSHISRVERVLEVEFFERETRSHIVRVETLLGNFAAELGLRGSCHDASKFSPQERDLFIELSPKLRACDYGSEEYNGFRAQLKPTLDHHYACNRHHPEYFELFKCDICASVLRKDETWIPNLGGKNLPDRLCSRCCPDSAIYECVARPYVGLEGMTLIDLIEMLCDWKGASERHSTGDIRKSIEINQERFHYSDSMKTILLNTADAMGW